MLFLRFEAIRPVMPLRKLGPILQRKKPHFPVSRLKTKKNVGIPINIQWKFFFMVHDQILQLTRVAFHKHSIITAIFRLSFIMIGNIIAFL
jgi:hypothetical protein